MLQTHAINRLIISFFLCLDDWKSNCIRFIWSLLSPHYCKRMEIFVSITLYVCNLLCKCAETAYSLFNRMTLTVYAISCCLTLNTCIKFDYLLVFKCADIQLACNDRDNYENRFSSDWKMKLNIYQAWLFKCHWAQQHVDIWNNNMFAIVCVNLILTRSQLHSVLPCVCLWVTKREKKNYLFVVRCKFIATAVNCKRVWLTNRKSMSVTSHYILDLCKY